MKRPMVLGALLVLMVMGTGARPWARTQSPAPSRIERLRDGIRVRVGGAFLTLQVKTDAIVRVLYAKSATPAINSLVVVGPGDTGVAARLNPFQFAGSPGRTSSSPATPFSVSSDGTSVTLKTAKLLVRVNRGDGAVTFSDAGGRTILAESPGGHVMTPATAQGEQTFQVQQRWLANADESLYGLGQRQEGKLNLKGYDLDLWQRNMVVAVPFLLSSRGYGILWDNNAVAKFGDTRPFEPIPPSQLIDMSNRAGGVTAGIYAGGRGDLISPEASPAIVLGRGVGPGGTGRAGGRGGAPPVRAWLGDLVAPATGDYQFQVYSNGDTKVWLDEKLMVDHYKQVWATEYDQFKVRLQAGRRYPIKVTNGTGGTTLEVRWKTPPPNDDTSLWSEAGDAIDYYFVYGPASDDVIAGYRALTGRATMLPQWAFGFFQSKNKYNTQKEVLDTLAEFRRREIPIDTIVQDWQYWPIDFWGDHQFEASRYPDPAAMIKTIHDQHARFMISVWGKYYPTTNNYKAMDAIGALYKTTIDDGTKDWLNRNYTFYDAFSAPGRKLFWNQVNTALFSKGVDAWWMDATEPDIVQPSPPTLEALRRDVDKTALGTASRVMNAYGLMNSEAVYDGQRSVAPDQRVFILTRSGYAGQARYATVTWSGDITSTWSTMRKQIAAGLSFSAAGNPYWTTDTGGYTMESRFTSARSGPDLEEWRELNARWFQYSTFTPILRVHGTDRPREMWNIGDETTPVYQTQLKFDRLRYALFPYIYSLAGRVTQEGYTMMRPLVMDFPADRDVRDLADQYMFGPAFLVCPVTTYDMEHRDVQLPAGTTWFDFWTGKSVSGGLHLIADAPYDRLPLFVRAGSIVPFAPPQQYIGHTPATTMTLHVYAGADGQFTLYEDDGLTYGYERQQFARIPISWNNQTRTLTIGARTGTFPGMLQTRTFDVVLHTADAPAGYDPAATGRRVTYSGAVVRAVF